MITTLPSDEVTPTSNSTGVSEVPEWVYTLYTWVAVIQISLIMLAMGCGTSLETIIPLLKRPVAPAIGLVCQFILMPLLCFGLAHAYRLEAHLAIGMVLVGSCPGGATSNMFTFWSDGDLDLSVTMTAISTVVAVFFMPLNTFLYTRAWTDESAVIPYYVMVAGIVLTWVPVGVGININKRWPTFAAKFIRIGSILGFGLLCFNGVVQRYAYPEVFQLPWYVWFCAITHPLIGGTMGFLLAWACHRGIKQRRTVAFETGIQNVGLALALISLSYDGPDASLYSQYILIYAGMSITDAVCVSIAHRSYFRTMGKRTACHNCYYSYQHKKEQAKMSSNGNTAEMVSVDVAPVDGSSYDLELWSEGLDLKTEQGWDLGSGNQVDNLLQHGKENHETGSTH